MRNEAIEIPVDTREDVYQTWEIHAISALTIHPIDCQPVANGAENLDIVESLLSRFQTRGEIDWLENAIGLAKEMVAENPSPGVME